jgi:tetratricopeptide (TPR) repeat protein
MKKCKVQSEKRKTKVQSLKFFLVLSFSFACFSVLSFTLTFAQDNNKLVTLTKQIIEAKGNVDTYLAFEELKGLYFKENKYNEFVELLNSLTNQKKTLEPVVNYYMGLTRYYQLKYLEEKQNWDEYFSQGNTYRNEISSSLQKTIDTLSAQDVLNIYAKLILWKFHRDQQDAFSESALSSLVDSISMYAKDTTNLVPIKDVAGELVSYGEKGKAKELYRIYVDKIVASNVKDDELNNIALGFYKEGNLELAEAIYDAYVARITKSAPKEKLVPILIDIARSFSYKDEGLKDVFYAEKIFQKIEEIGTKDAFDEELIYMRAFNLEKAKEYPKTKDLYLDLVKRYPKTSHAEEANFKIAIIYTYILRDIKTGRSYFEGLAQKETLSPQVISSLYQLGLLSQWEEDFGKAKEYYNKLMEKAGSNFQETVALTKERLKEIGEVKPIEYNLKTFLDISLKEENAIFDATKVDLRASSYNVKESKEVNIESTTYTAESGCMQVELQYLWSGHLGNTLPSLDASSFNTAYTEPGTKEINLVVVSSTGIIDRNIDMIDVR